jgi:hypothetical protein
MQGVQQRGLSTTQKAEIKNKESTWETTERLILFALGVLTRRSHGRAYQVLLR